MGAIKLMEKIVAIDMHWSNDTIVEYPKVCCKNYLPLIVNDVNMISATGGIGKTFVSLINTLHFLKENNDDTSTAYIWSTEDVPGLMKAREVAVVAKYLSEGIDFRKQTDRICYGYSHQHFTQKIGGVMAQTQYFVDAMIQLVAFDLVVIDPLLNFFGGDSENDNQQARFFMTLLKTYAAKFGITFLVVHHGRKGDGATRGASAFQDTSRLAYELQYAEDGGLIAKMTKSNYTGKKGDIRLNPIPESRFFPREYKDEEQPLTDSRLSDDDQPF
jgi:hypothetical protein